MREVDTIKSCQDKMRRTLEQVSAVDEIEIVNGGNFFNHFILEGCITNMFCF